MCCEEVVSAQFHDFEPEDEYVISTATYGDEAGPENFQHADDFRVTSSPCSAAELKTTVPFGELIVAETYLQNEEQSHKAAKRHNIPLIDAKAMCSRSNLTTPSQEAIIFQNECRKRARIQFPRIEELEELDVSSEYLAFGKRGKFNAEEFLDTPITTTPVRPVRYSAPVIEKFLNREKLIEGSSLYCSPGTGAQCAANIYPPLIYKKGVPRHLQQRNFKTSGKVFLSDGSFSPQQADVVFTHGLYGHVANALISGYSLKEAIEEWKALEEWKAQKYIANYSVGVIKFIRKHVKTKVKRSTRKRCDPPEKDGFYRRRAKIRTSL